MKDEQPYTESIWARLYGGYNPNQCLSESKTTDVVIVGGGFSGLSTAWHIKQINPAASVTVIEANFIGFGASGRAAGNCFSLFGESIATVKTLYGPQKTLEAHRYMKLALTNLRQLISDQNMTSDYVQSGFLRVATSKRLERKLISTYNTYEKLGIADDFKWLNTEALRKEFPESPFVAGILEEQGALLNPLKHVREWKRLCQNAGVDIYEQTPTRQIHKGKKIVVETPNGTISADTLVLATNAYTHLIKGLPRITNKQSPIWSYIISTYPLTDDQWRSIGWPKRQALYDALNLLHYVRPCEGGRICVGGGRPSTDLGCRMEADPDREAWIDLEKTLKGFFPALQTVQVECRWGGPLSVTADMAPVIGFLGDRRVIFSFGFIGHGIPITQLNGKTIAELVCGQQSELTEFWAVNRLVFPWPPEPFRYMLKRSILATMSLHDLWSQRQ